MPYGSWEERCLDGHTDGGRLVEQLYGHPDAAIARKRIREAFRSSATVTPLVTNLVTAA
jgi:hypothetical protein